MKIILDFLLRERHRAEVAFERLQTDEAAARLHEVTNIYEVINCMTGTATNFEVELMEDGKMPFKAHPSDAGWDIFSTKEVEMYPNDIKIIPTGVKLALSEGWEAQVRSRSGNASNGLFVLNSPGTIDAGYRGEIKVIMKNVSPHLHVLPKGAKVAQLVFQRVENVLLEKVEKVKSDTDRKEAGFGSTDNKSKE